MGPEEMKMRFNEIISSVQKVSSIKSNKDLEEARRIFEDLYKQLENK